MATQGRQPTYSYEMERVPLIGSLNNRLASSSKDQVFYNGVIDIITNPQSKASKIYFNKRGGFTAQTTVIGGGGTARGIYYWGRTGYTYTVIGRKLYYDTTEIGTDIFTNSTGTVWFTETTGTSDALFVSDGNESYKVSLTNVQTLINDADFPAGFTMPVSLDGYVFGFKSGTDEIWNSDVDDPTAWTANSFIAAEMYPDNIVALVRQVNYIVAFGSYSTEFFYDNENPSGSPLRRSETVAFKVGCAARDSVSQVDKRLYWVGQAQNGEPGVWTFDGLKPDKVSTEFIDKILVNEAANLSSAISWICHHKGHTLYILNLNSRTLVYDVEEKVWMDWSIYSSGNHAVLPFKYATQGPNNTIYVLHSTDGKIYKLDPGTHQDDAGAILCTIITSRVDFGDTHWKHQLRLELVSDIQTTGTVIVDWSDDDYQNWRDSRTLDLTTRPFTKAGGAFRRRAYRLRHTANAPFRAEALDIDFRKGVS